MTIKILKAVAIHGTMILRLARSASACSDGFFHEVIDLRAALARKTDKNLGALGGVADGLVSEGLEKTLDEKHGKHVLPKNQARRLVVPKLRLQPETKALEEPIGALKVFHRKINVDLSFHCASHFSDLMASCRTGKISRTWISRPAVPPAQASASDYR